MSNPNDTPIPVSISMTRQAVSYSLISEARHQPFGAGFGKNGHYQDQSTPAFSVWILERSAPNNPPVYQKLWNVNTEVPDGLDNYLTDDYLLFFAFTGWISSAPSGALYQSLMENGGGGELRGLETWATQLACGANGVWWYGLISSPGTGNVGIEASAISNTILSYGTNPSVSSVNVGPFSVYAGLLRGDGGKYTPVRFGPGQ